MNNDQIARCLLESSAEYHEMLINLARGISRFQELLSFINDCIDFANQNIPEEIYSEWMESNPYVPLIEERFNPLYSFNSDNPLIDLGHLTNTSASGTTDAFSFLMVNYNFYETKKSRDEFLDLSVSYKGLLARPEDIAFVHRFIEPINSTADEKFIHALESMDSLPENEDPQGCLLEMRSAIDLTIKTLLDMTGLTKKELKLKAVQQIPAIARCLAIDDQSRVDLLLANNGFEKLKSQLAASKDIKYPKEKANAIMNQSIAFLNQIASSIDVPNKN